MTAYEKVHHMRFRFTDFRTRLYFSREQEQCLKNCTLPLNFLSDIWEDARFHPWRFQGQVSVLPLGVGVSWSLQDLNPSISHGTNVLSLFHFSKAPFVHRELVDDLLFELG